MVMPINFYNTDATTAQNKRPDISIVPREEASNLGPESVYMLIEIIPNRTKALTATIFAGLIDIINAKSGSQRELTRGIVGLLKVSGVRNLTPDLAHMAINRLVAFIMSKDSDEVVRQVQILAKVYAKIKQVQFNPVNEFETPVLPFDEVETKETSSLQLSSLSEKQLLSLRIELNEDLARRNVGKSILDLYLSSAILQQQGLDVALKSSIKAFRSSVSELIELHSAGKLSVNCFLNKPNFGFKKLAYVLEFLDRVGLIKLSLPEA